MSAGDRRERDSVWYRVLNGLLTSVLGDVLFYAIYRVRHHEYVRETGDARGESLTFSEYRGSVERRWA